MTAALAFLKAAWGIAKLIPWQIYVVIGLFAAAYAYGLSEHHIGYKEAKDEDAKIAEAKQKAQDAANALANAKLFSVAYTAQKQADFLAWKLEDEKKDNAVQLAAAKSKEPNYVSPLALGGNDPILPRGYILWRVDTAAYANGIDFPDAPAAPAGTLGQPSGVSLSTFSDVDLAQATAFREAVQWGSAWKDRANLLETTCNAIITTAKGSP